MKKNLFCILKPGPIVFLVLLLFLKGSVSAYWQQDVRYNIDVKLNTVDQLLVGVEQLTYINNSPDSLSELYIHLYPNAYKNRESIFAKEMEEMGKYGFAFSHNKDRGWIDIDSLFVGQVRLQQDVSLLDARRAVNMAKKFVNNVFLVENMSYLKCPNCGSEINIFGRGRTRGLSDELNINFLGELPLDIKAREATEQGSIPVLDLKSDFTTRFDDIINKMKKYLENA